MPAPINLLVTQHGLSPDDLQKAFDVATIEQRPKVKKLVECIRDSIRTGIERNRRDYRLYKAMDWSYDQPFYQVSYTQLRGLLSSGTDDKKVQEMVNQWGLTHLLQDVTKNGQACCGADGKPLKALNLPVFFNVFIPVVMAYVTIRWAKLFLDRNQTPTYKYEPVQYTKDNRLRCEVITQIIQRMSAWFDYPADIKQTILQTLMYGICLKFPREAWFCEKQLNEEGKEVIVREGLRFNMPHPSRVYYDLYHRLSTLNSNSGCEYAGYWCLKRYSEINDNPLYWNKDRITFGASAWFDIGYSDFFEQVTPCQMSFPRAATDGAGGTGQLDRESAAALTYSQGDKDAATLETNHFMRIVPKDHGLGTYPHPIWMRFVMASDNAVLWAEPLAFDVIPTYAYDADFNRARHRSMTLELTPFQDKIGQLFSQWILSVKENLNNPIFYDKDKIPAEYIKRIEDMGQKMYGARIFIPFSSTENYRFKTDQKEAFHAPGLTRHNTGEILALINGALNLMDRVLQMSPQEIGQAAAHEQTAEESRIIDRNTSSRVKFTDSFIDSGENATKKMLYDATMAHADDGIIVGISSSFTSSDDELKELIKKLGMTVADDEEAHADGDVIRRVKSKKSALSMEAFASTRGEADRINNPAIADAMAKMFLAVANNPVLIQSVGAPQLIELLNQIIIVAGLPKEFRLRGKDVDTANPEGAQPDQQVAQLQEQLVGLAQQVRTAIDEAQKQTIEATTQLIAQAAQQNAQIDTQQQQQIEGLGEAIKQLSQAVAITAEAAQQQTQQPPPMAPLLSPPTQQPIGVPA